MQLDCMFMVALRRLTLPRLLHPTVRCLSLCAAVHRVNFQPASRPGRPADPGVGPVWTQRLLAGAFAARWGRGHTLLRFNFDFKPWLASTAPAL